MSIAENLIKIKKNIPENVKLVAVTKTHPEEVILEAYKTGHKIFGENKAQELQRKHHNLPEDIEWHMIGHLQTNKVKYIIPFVSLIHSVDSLKLLETINKEGEKNNRIVECLFQLKIASEETKSGFEYSDLINLLKSGILVQMRNVKITGLMGMSTFTDNMDQVQKEFNFLSVSFKKIKEDFFSSDPSFKDISMGMSDDYPVAIKEGATIIRVGSSIFGKRNY